MALPGLSPRQRGFCALVARAAIANPFGEERQQIDRQIAGIGPNVPWERANALALDRIASEVGAMAEAGLADLRQWSGEERRLLELTFAFEIFHRFAPELDAHIHEQTQAGDAPVLLGCAASLLDAFRQRGFEAEALGRYVAVAFQIRRAFFFIGRSLVGRCRSMRRLREDLWNCVFTHDLEAYARSFVGRMEDFSTLILGQTGTGKGTAAAAIGRSGHIPFDAASRRFRESFTRAFVAINLSQFSPSLIESELFGHRKGAFTGAVEAHQGVFAGCSPHGSIFLDEIGEVSTELQIKLLRLLEQRVFSPVGSHEKVRFQGRIVAATNRDLGRLRAEGRFRDDLYYRLCSDVITVPPLRQRIAEDPRELNDLVEQVVAAILGAPSPEVAAEVRRVIDRNLGPEYSWPGNVRELEQCVRRVVLRRDYHGSQAAQGGDALSRLVEDLSAGRLPARSLLSRYCALLYDRCGTYEEVAAITGLDRRTVRKHVRDSHAD